MYMMTMRESMENGIRQDDGRCRFTSSTQYTVRGVLLKQPCACDSELSDD